MGAARCMLRVERRKWVVEAPGGPESGRVGEHTGQKSRLTCPGGGAT